MIGASNCNPFEPVRVEILNDTDGSVTVYQCRDEACSELHNGGSELNPAETVEVSTDDQGTPNPYKITRPNGTVVGCLPLIFHGRPDEEPVIVRVSEAVACRTNYD